MIHEAVFVKLNSTDWLDICDRSLHASIVSEARTVEMKHFQLGFDLCFWFKKNQTEDSDEPTHTVAVRSSRSASETGSLCD